jgi:putative alpha-1,2-mannosidase
MFTTGRGGLPGNNDSGGLTSCYIWNALGLFPVAGQPVVLIGSPLFESSTLQLADKTFTVRRESQSPAQIYVQSATLNGKNIDRAYLAVGELMAGGTLTLTMGDQPSAWARDHRPPSYSPDS